MGFLRESAGSAEGESVGTDAFLDFLQQYDDDDGPEPLPQEDAPKKNVAPPKKTDGADADFFGFGKSLTVKGSFFLDLLLGSLRNLILSLIPRWNLDSRGRPSQE